MIIAWFQKKEKHWSANWYIPKFIILRPVLKVQNNSVHLSASIIKYKSTLLIKVKAMIVIEIRIASLILHRVCLTDTFSLQNQVCIYN